MHFSTEHINHSAEISKKESQPIDDQKRAESLRAIHADEEKSNSSVELAELGLSLQDVFSDKETHNLLTDSGSNNSNTKNNDEVTEASKSVKERFAELQKLDLFVASILSTLKAEFSDSMDEETGAVIDKYSSLLSPEIFTDKEELEAVETLFYTQSHDFTAESFSSFVHTIYEEPDSVISEGSKQKIKKAFNIPRMPVVTGRDLAKATALTDPAGNLVHHSKDSALEFRPGVKTFMNKEMKAMLLVQGASRPHPMIVSPDVFGDSEAMAKLTNYALIQQAVYDELGQLTNLFGGGQEDEVATPDSTVVTRTNRFATLLIGKSEPNMILSDSQLSSLRAGLRTLRNPALIG